jgi:hypothetical protein
VLADSSGKSAREAQVYQEWIGNDRKLRGLTDEMRQVAVKVSGAHPPPLLGTPGTSASDRVVLVRYVVVSERFPSVLAFITAHPPAQVRLMTTPHLIEAPATYDVPEHHAGYQLAYLLHEWTSAVQLAQVFTSVVEVNSSASEIEEEVDVTWSMPRPPDEFIESGAAEFQFSWLPSAWPGGTSGCRRQLEALTSTTRPQQRCPRAC